jgi:glycosyltransferase involved in cell wall biosynthesis
VEVVVAGNYPGTVVAAEVSDAKRSVWCCMEPNRRLHPRETFRTLAARVDATSAAQDTRLLAAARLLFERHAAALASGGELARQKAADVAAVARLDRVVAISGFTAESVRQVYGRPADAVVYPTVSEGDMPHRSPGMDPAGLRVLVHGRLEVLKNIEMVLLGFAAFRERHPGAHELHVVGRGPDEVRLREIARERGIESAVRFHGFVEQNTLEELYARCEVMALLPPDEPFGMVYPEAAQRGLLLVGPDHGGPFEILDGGALGWTVDIFSAEPLADAFAEAWRLPVTEAVRRRERVATACRDRYGATATLPALLTVLTG